MKTVKEVSLLANISVRTLHYYDQIGLLKPKKLTDGGYRLYGEEELLRLQQILFFRELGFPLKEILAILTHPSFNADEALEKQHALLILQRARLDGLIAQLEKAMKGEKQMNFNVFDDSAITKHREEYAEETRKRWGDTEAYAQSEKKAARYSKEDWAKIQTEMGEIFSAFAAIRHTPPESDAAKELVKRWQDFITEYFYTCSDEILAGLGQMYTADERFTKNIDKSGEGTAAFISAAIAAYLG